MMALLFLDTQQTRQTDNRLLGSDKRPTLPAGVSDHRRSQRRPSATTLVTAARPLLWKPQNRSLFPQGTTSTTTLPGAEVSAVRYLFVLGDDRCGLLYFVLCLLQLLPEDLF